MLWQQLGYGKDTIFFVHGMWLVNSSVIGRFRCGYFLLLEGRSFNTHVIVVLTELRSDVAGDGGEEVSVTIQQEIRERIMLRAGDESLVRKEVWRFAIETRDNKCGLHVVDLKYDQATV
ncbi:hypothetical protein KEJ39_01020 [Candidatus Bathyarchaeota archaeon]|nr:hypothetical protein [Candidatus Bathyarchaeota archaeon]